MNGLMMPLRRNWMLWVEYVLFVGIIWIKARSCRVAMSFTFIVLGSGCSSSRPVLPVAVKFLPRKRRSLKMPLPMATPIMTTPIMTTTTTTINTKLTPTPKLKLKSTQTRKCNQIKPPNLNQHPKHPKHPPHPPHPPHHLLLLLLLLLSTPKTQPRHRNKMRMMMYPHSPASTASPIPTEQPSTKNPHPIFLHRFVTYPKGK
mmetsp:Transcript_27779/g.41088  ORF Transcript_27779/g.41088 Transcript_27779/m.41088 type:complete len:202 (+) Transcript_27779:1295-1900(+)